MPDKPEDHSEKKSNWPLFIAGGALVVGLLIYCIWLRWEGVTLTVKVSDLPGLLAPVVFAAAVIERTVEILISPWRDTGADRLETNLAVVKAQPADGAKPDAQKAAANTLHEYRGTTQRYAFAVSLLLSLCTSIAGVRALGPFLDSAKFAALAGTHPGQHAFFLTVDVMLSATLLAGGADGIHSIVNAVTSFFNATADKATKQANS